MKTIKTFCHILLSITATLLLIQSLLALLVQFIPLQDITSLHINITGQVGLGSLAALLIRNGIWVFGLRKLNQQIKNFQPSDVLTEGFSKKIKNLSFLILLADLFSSYLATTQAPLGTYIIDLKYSVSLLIAGFACDYARRYMKKANISM